MTVYFTLDNKKNLSNLDEKAVILSPSSYEANVDHKIDPILKNIYKELYDRSFNISGIDIEFKAIIKDNYTDKNGIEISNIRHEEFSMYFYGNSMMTFKYKEREINFYSDSSPTTVYTYVGNDWEEDKKAFWHGFKTNSKLKNHKRIFIEYSCEKGENEFKNNTDDREYQPQGSEPFRIKRSTEINKLKNFLLGLLDELEQLPKSEFDHTIFDYEKSDLKEPLNLTCFYDSNDFNLEDIKLTPGKRLISLSGFTPEGEFDDVYNDGFIYTELSTGQEEPVNTKDHVVRDTSRMYKVEIELKYSDCVYVLDLEPVDNFIKSMQNANKFNFFGDNNNTPEAKELTEAERKLEYNKALVSKMVKLTDYDGTFIKPMYITNRLIRQDEIKTVKKCKTKDYRRATNSEELLDF